RPTASACMSGMMTKPPPNDSAPTLNATHATEARTPPLSTAGNSAPENNGAITGKPPEPRQDQRHPSYTTPSPPPPPAQPPHSGGAPARNGADRNNMVISHGTMKARPPPAAPARPPP